MKGLWIPRLRSPVPALSSPDQDVADQVRAGLAPSALLKASFGLLLLGLVACGTVTTGQPESETPESMQTSASIPDLGPAPELTNEIWLNVDAPLRLASLRGKVVAIDMWTFG